ncbi:pyridoxamine 5'-phosphate oxidase family protein [Gordonia terrae]|uniref:pyridoxamine 5'-phosphate oxidase family protein n=1 Tax=Gordonia hongkongensis TaxID=1701090 RepID=UPI0022B36DDD|nr:pyridoxamine 5'-phosphate oxidase family protein [Gordonia terrae]
MYETPDELHELQTLLDASLSRSTDHLRSIISSENTVGAPQLVEILTGMRVLALSTVTAAGEPRISAVDGHFLHGKWIFGTARTAAKARHLTARPAASAAHIQGEELGVFTHGTVEILNPLDGDRADDWPELVAHFQKIYGDDAFDWDVEVIYFRLHPHWMTVYAPNQSH